MAAANAVTSSLAGLTVDDSSRAKSSAGIYRPLNRDRKEIRLLLLKAGTNYFPLRCELQQAFLDKDPKPKYETISYCWGSAKETKIIILNGRKKRIPATAAAALRAMRLPHSDRVLWIDSVCINQSDLAERGHQVALMYEVFSTTRQNLVWLGESDEETAAALDLMGVVLDDARAATHNFEKFRDIIWRHDGSWNQAFLSLPSGFDFQPLLNLYDRPWFLRLWVAQEAALPTLSLCIIGSHSIPLEMVLRAATWMIFNRDGFSENLVGHAGLRAAVSLFHVLGRAQGYFWLGAPSRAIFVALLRAHRKFNVAEPRDHIYGLLGMFQQLAGVGDLPDLLAPDYEKPLAEVMRDATLWALTEVDDLCWAFDQLIPDWTRESGWPSWVPPWHVQFDSNTGARSFSGHFYAHNGLNQEPKSYPELSSPETLLLSGFAVDTVSQTTSIMTRTGLEDVERLRDFVQECRALLPVMDHAAEMAQLVDVLTAGVDADDRIVDEARALAFEKWHRYISEQKKLPPTRFELRQKSGNPSEEEMLVCDCHRALCTACFNRRVFIAGKSYLGLGPETVQIGDVLAVVHKCTLPIVLRPHGEYYELIGNCYVHGIMFGEAVQKHKEEGKDVTVFRVR